MVADGMNYNIFDFFETLAFEITPFFYKILSMSIIAAAIGIITIILLKLLKKKLSPNYKYLLWVVMIIALILPYRPTSPLSVTAPIDSINWMQHRDDYEELLKYTDEGSPPLTYEQELEMDSLYNSIEIRKAIFDNILPLVWLFGTITSFFLLIISKIRLTNLISNSEAFEGGKEILERCKNRLSIKREIEMVISDKVPAPALTGVITPVILLPEYAETLDEKNLEFIIMHELSHCKRWDMQTNYLLAILQSIHWFNPVIAVCFKLLRADLETANDASVIKKLSAEERSDYAKSLVLILGKSGKVGAVQTKLSMVSDAKNVENRISMIKLRKYFSKNKIVISAISLILVAGLSLFMLTGAGKTEELIEANIVFNQADGEIQVKMELQTDWTIKAENPEHNIVVAGEFFEESYIYEGETAIGFIGYSQFEPYTGEIAREQYYQSVYPALRLSRFFLWEPYTALISTETTEAAVANVSFLDPDIVSEYMGELASAPYENYQGILYYDTALQSYIAMGFRPDMVSEEEAIRIAESITLSGEYSDDADEANSGQNDENDAIPLVKYSDDGYNGYDIGEGKVLITDENNQEVCIIDPMETIINAEEYGEFLVKDYGVLADNIFLLINSNDLGFFYTIYDADAKTAVYQFVGVEDSGYLLNSRRYYNIRGNGLLIADIGLLEQSNPAYYLYSDGEDVFAQEFPAEYGYNQDLTIYNNQSNGEGRYIAFVNQSTELVDIYNQTDNGLQLISSEEFDKELLEERYFLGEAYLIDANGNLEIKEAL